MSLIRRSLRSWLASGWTLVLVVGVACHVWAAGSGMEDLAGALRPLALAAQAGRAIPANAGAAGLTVRGSQVQVEIVYRSSGAAGSAVLGRFGAIPELRHGNRVQAYVPAGQLLALAALPEVAQVRPAVRMLPLQGFGAVCSEGVQLTNATAFHLAGLNGAGARVAVIDVGFSNLNANEVPVTATAGILSYPTGYSPYTSAHGTAVAEVVADMAPECTMTLIAVGTELGAISAVNYVTQNANNFDVVVMALGVVDGPFDGSHDLSQAVNKARAAGLFWVNSAGNFAQRHWEGAWSDRDGDNFCELTSGGQEYVLLSLTAGSTFDAYLSWFQSSGATVTARDYDLVLTTDADNGTIVAQSAVVQNGDDPPQEQLRAYVDTTANYRLKIESISGEDSGEPEGYFQLYTPGVDMGAQTQVANNSLAIPAEAAGAFAVGATRGSALPATGTLSGLPIDRIEPFSSRRAADAATGVTQKPDLVAPDSVTTSLTLATTPGVDTLNPFLGTSASAAHVAGAACLLLSEDTSRTAADLKTLLLNLAIPYASLPYDRAHPEDEPAYGAGRLGLRVGENLDGQAPTISIDFPANNSTITVVSPRVTASISDNGSIDSTSIQAWLDGTQVVLNGAVVTGSRASDYVYVATDTKSATVKFTLNNLTRTRHTLQLQASDASAAQNVSDKVASNFRVTAPTITAGLHIITLPYPGLANSDPQEIFGVPIGDIALARWVPSDGNYSKYHVYPDEYATFAPPDGQVPSPPAGLGYFVRLGQDGVLSITASGLTDDSYNINLIRGTSAPRGWNLIGNPYENSVDWGSVEFISGNGRQDLTEATDPDKDPVTDGVLYEWVPTSSGGYYTFAVDPTQDTLEPLAGYWLHVLKDATLVVYNPGATAAARPLKPKQATPAAVGPDNWLLQLQATSGQYTDPVNYVGVSSRATDGYDLGQDVAEPPAIVDTLRLTMPRSSWGAGSGNYAKDVRGSLGERQEWDLEVSCRLANAPVTLAWPRLNATVPKDVALRLVDLDSGAATYMRTSSGYTYQQTAPGVRHLRVVATRAGVGALVVTGLSAAPVGNTVSFSYSVSADATVTGEIRNLAGVLIQTLSAQQATTGTAQTLVWNGVTGTGVRAPAGKYLARITARTADGQTVQALRPFSLVR